MLRTYLFVSLGLSICTFTGLAQTSAGLPENPAATGYDPHALFAPGFYSGQSKPYHAANGAPAPNYWQNRADYVLQASLDTVNNTLKGSETIRYTNNSPDSLHSLWLQMDQNTYRGDARSNYFTEGASLRHTDGYVLESV